MSKTRTLAVVSFLALIFAVTSRAPAQDTSAEFQKAVADYQKSASVSDAEKVIKLAVAMDQLPPTPEEARKHFVRGGALLKDAKSPEDFNQVIDEFKQATDLAPWWPEARLNLALVWEAAGDYPKAIANLKLYQFFKLPDAEARDVQDKIYALEAKNDKAAKEEQAAAAKKAAELETAQDKMNSLEGEWLQQCSDGSYIPALRITRTPDGWVVKWLDQKGQPRPDMTFQPAKVKGRHFDASGVETETYKGMTYANKMWISYTLSEDGMWLTGQMAYNVNNYDGNTGRVLRTKTESNKLPLKRKE